MSLRQFPIWAVWSGPVFTLYSTDMKAQQTSGDDQTSELTSTGTYEGLSLLTSKPWCNYFIGNANRLINEPQNINKAKRSVKVMHYGNKNKTKNQVHKAKPKEQKLEQVPTYT